MPKKRKFERYAGKYFSWALLTRKGVFWADGRSNPINAGRHSLGTKVRAEAVEALKQLDLTIAVQHRLADAAELQSQPGNELPLDVGRKLYEEHTRRSMVSKGIRKSSQKRYRAVLDKFLPYLQSKNITCWNCVTATIVEQYLSFLEAEKYAYATLCLEGTTIKQIMNFFILKKLLPRGTEIVLAIRKSPRDGHLLLANRRSACDAFPHPKQARFAMAAWGDYYADVYRASNQRAH